MDSYFYDGISIKNKRTINMDSLLLREHIVAEQRLILAVVCDGVGSMEDGAFASAYAVRALNEWLNQATDTWRLGLRMRDRILEINEEIITEAQLRGLQTASTLSALLLVGSRFYIVHTGDSRIYSWTGRQMEQLTVDQSQGGKLTACLGHSGYTYLTYNEGICGGKHFLLCSDGLYKRTDMGYLCDELSRTDKKSIKKTMGNLVQHVIERGGTDNISLALVICES